MEAERSPVWQSRVGPCVAVCVAWYQLLSPLLAFDEEPVPIASALGMQAAKSAGELVAKKLAACEEQRDRLVSAIASAAEKEHSAPDPEPLRQQVSPPHL